jgi:hypothetical protein
VGRLVIVAALVLLALPATASAGALRDCIYDHDLDRSYSLSELKRAIDEIPAEHDEYGLCREILTNAMHERPDDGGSAGPSAPGAPGNKAQPDEGEDSRGPAAITREAGGGDAGADYARPGPERATHPEGLDGTFGLASGSRLPTPLLLALIALALLTAAGGVVALRERSRSPSPRGTIR